MAYVITINDCNGKEITVEVSHEVYEFDKEYCFKENYQEYKKRKHSGDRKYEISLENIYELNRKMLESLTTSSSEEICLENIDIEKLYNAIDSLPEKQRRQFILRYAHDLTVSQIAGVEKCNERAIKSSLKKCLCNLPIPFLTFSAPYI